MTSAVRATIGVFAFVVYLVPGMWGAPLKCISGYLPPITTQDFVLGQTAYQPADAVVDNGNVRTDDIPVPTGRKYSDFLKMPYAYRASSTTMKL